MKQVSVYLPERIYHLLEKMREENIIPSISEFIRNVVILTIFQGKLNRERESEMQKKTQNYKHRSKKAYTLNKQVKKLSPLPKSERKRVHFLRKADMEPQHEGRSDH